MCVVDDFQVYYCLGFWFCTGASRMHLRRNALYYVVVVVVVVVVAAAAAAAAAAVKVGIVVESVTDLTCSITQFCTHTTIELP